MWERPGDGVVACHELIQQLGGDCQTIAAREGENLALVAEGCAHDNSFVAELLVVPAQNVTFKFRSAA